ncbi:CPXCG motif-containing cysteine-rich protein [Vibrio amylolyticus]|uniref:CPXCG motif-containing cysteine-rich protein n=1 Tax=Vibrio TaxID=662 RepID=UPI000C83EA56|nr:CPXCG motif-containing cysteine-rich protein [Vibrio sp. 10N.261.55.A7]PMJ92125.1 molybdopterin-guanine dinucleotide biosynthesis protein A [Vibrio sp. 10N.261.55.A7]
MISYTEKKVQCPHCEHTIGLTLDASNGSQEFHDECPHCYRAIRLNMLIDHNLQHVDLTASIEDEPFS